ncbi:MAG: uroporphyrinogen-III synthase [Paracoccaceae bacterium]
MVPQSRALPVLITRPEPQASRFALALRDRYGDRVAPILTPLLAPTLFQPALPEGPFASVVLTSETGARAAAALASALPRRAYCVGDQTAQIATGLGFQADSAMGDAESLFQLLAKRTGHAPFLHLRGREARGDLAARLTAAGVPAQEVIVYAQEARPLSPEALHLLAGEGLVIAPLFSPRSAEVFRRALREIPQAADLPGRLQIAALSPAVAAVFADHPPRSMAVATAPTLAKLFFALDRFIFIA